MALREKPAVASTMDEDVIAKYASAEPGSAESEKLFNQLIDFENTGETVEAPETSQEEVYIVKSGDTLMEISQELQVPLKELAERNAIRDVNVIMPGQEIRYSKPGELLVETDISAPKLPEDEGGISPLTGREVLPGSEDPTEGDLGQFTVDTKEEGVLGPPPVLAPGDEVTKSEQEMVADFKSVPVVEEPKLDGPPVVEEEIAEVTEEPGVVPGERSGEATAKHTKQIIIDSSPKESQSTIQDVFDEIDALGYEVPDNKYYEDIAKNINDKITGYNTKISAVAEEKMKPTFEGWDKFLAVLGSALGAYGSSMTGVPNFALQIVNKAIDRDTQAFLKSKEARTKSLENQRMDLIMMRGEKLQMAQNRVTQLMQSATFELSKTKTKADIKAIYDKLAQELALNKENMQLVLAGYIKDLIVSDASIRASISKDERKRYVNSYSTTDAEGNTVIIPGYIARDAKSAEKLTEDQAMTTKALDDIKLLDELYATNEKYIPAWLGGKVSQQIDRIAKRLELTFKRIEGMGANYTVYEASLIRGILPTADIIDKISKYKVKSAMLKNELIQKLRTSAKVRGQESQIVQTIASQENIQKFGGTKISN